MTAIFKRRSVEELLHRAATLQTEVDATAAAIVHDVRHRGEPALRHYAEMHDRLAPGSPLILGREVMRDALDGMAPDDRTRLTRIAARIREFAERQRQTLTSFDMPIPGGKAGHQVAPVLRAGCYAPGGRYPLPSSLLMTAVSARVAGVREVWVASSRPDAIMLACGALAEADAFVVSGGAHAIAALAFGAGDIPACDLIVGPGSAYVTAAKRLVFGHVGIDALAGPSELVIVADESSDAGIIAADLLAQAEHDPMAIPILVTPSDSVVDAVNAALIVQLETLPTADVARSALGNGGAVVVRDLSDAIACCDELAPEHLHLQIACASDIAARFSHYGALFIGRESAEVLGDYGAGPNHVLPTGRTSRFSGGLSVFTFLRVRTWLRMDDLAASDRLFEDTAWLAREEGLEAHARAAELRLTSRRSRGRSGSDQSTPMPRAGRDA
jgi:histidinol dehydrogenase